jgi:glycosyltransferase involved in cell wall biosynthesis
MPGCNDTVTSGVNGYLVPPRKVEALAEAMLEFCRKPSLAAAMGRNSRALAERKFDVHQVNRMLLSRMGLI